MNAVYYSENYTEKFHPQTQRLGPLCSSANRKKKTNESTVDPSPWGHLNDWPYFRNTMLDTTSQKFFLIDRCSSDLRY